VTGVQVRPVEYLVNTWPEGHECSEVAHWSLLVAYRGHGLWAVEREWSHGSPKIVLTRSGEWDYDRRGDPEYRFTRDEALDLARAHAPLIEINGRTAAEFTAGHLARGCEG
jgi:hypothetical protein